MRVAELQTLSTNWGSLPFPNSPARTYAEGMHARPLQYYLSRVAKLGLGGERVLDAGCGTGTWSFALREHFEEVVGVDRNEPRVEMARWVNDHCGLDVTFETADVTALPYGDVSFDAIVCYGVVISYLSLEVVMAELRRVLRPGGCLYLCLNGLGWSMYLRDVRGATEERVAIMGRQGIYHTLCARLAAARQALVSANSQGHPGLAALVERAGEDEVKLAELVDAWLATERDLHGLAPVARLLAIECGNDYAAQFVGDVARLARGESTTFSHARAGRGHDVAEVRECAQRLGFERFRWAEEGHLAVPGTEVVVDPLFDGWFQGHQQVWECLMNRS